ncbi:MAG: SUMF1/EgtB/PvdO family nonheme iron enzyme [Myxococcota bacterium]
MGFPDDDQTFVTPSAERDEDPSEPELGDRYVDLGRIGVGGFGEVRRVLDRALDRVVAMKILPGGTGAARDAFEREARLTARLQHPGIVPVHDLGTLPNGRIWFTMREVRGATLSDRIDTVHACSWRGEWGTTPDGWTLRRLVDVLEAVAAVVAYAHAEGVVHCDVKPSNVMIGPFGEVQLLDWGISRAIDAARGPMQGTPAWLAPEVVLGEVPGPPSDVWALGGVLYRILTGHHLYPPGDVASTLAAVRAGPPVPPTERVGADHPRLPPELVEICARALARAPAERPEASRFAQELRGWLDGTQDRLRALRLSEGADEDLARGRALRVEAQGLRREADALLATVADHEPVERKRPAWSRLDEAERLEREAGLGEVRFVEAQRAALRLAPDLDAAHRRLATYYRERLAEAEARRLPEAAGYEVLLRTHDRGEHAAWLRGDAELVLATDPPGAEVVIERYATVDRRLVPTDPRSLGTTPVRATLSHGSYRVVLRAPGRAEVVYPIRLERAGVWDATVSLPPAGAIGPDECLVPGGWFACGGDPEAPEALPERRVWVDTFVIRRFPVTHDEYREFLQDLLDRGVDPTPHLPRHEAQDEPVYAIEGGRVKLGEWEGHPFEPAEPVVLVDSASAEAWCRWRAERDGLPWRLPHDLEWEKAARGVDQRVFPWGAHLDPTWTRMQRSSPVAPGPVPVSAYPDDVSPYGVRGLGGNVRDWCANPYRRNGPASDRIDVDHDASEGTGLRCVRGGSWHSGDLFCRSAGRLAGDPTARWVIVGFRPVRSLMEVAAP